MTESGNFEPGDIIGCGDEFEYLLLPLSDNDKEHWTLQNVFRVVKLNNIYETWFWSNSSIKDGPWKYLYSIKDIYNESIRP